MMELQIKELLAKLIKEQEEVIDDIPSDNPVTEPTANMADKIDIVLTTYPSLNEILIELMSEYFKTYINGIDIVAPKPTTFKVNLKNNLYFFLIYTGITYIAKIEGKKYYLLNVGESERASKAIANILTLGKIGGDTQAPPEETPVKPKSPKSKSEPKTPEVPGEEDNVNQELQEQISKISENSNLIFGKMFTESQIKKLKPSKIKKLYNKIKK